MRAAIFVLSLQMWLFGFRAALPSFPFLEESRRRRSEELRLLIVLGICRMAFAHERIQHIEECVEFFDNLKINSPGGKKSVHRVRPSALRLSMPPKVIRSHRHHAVPTRERGPELDSSSDEAPTTSRSAYLLVIHLQIDYNGELQCQLGYSSNKTKLDCTAQCIATSGRAGRDGSTCTRGRGGAGLHMAVARHIA
jgi:hypothetical protein